MIDISLNDAPNEAAYLRGLLERERVYLENVIAHPAPIWNPEVLPRLRERLACCQSILKKLGDQ